MARWRLIAAYEFRNCVRRRSFLILLLGVPLGLAALAGLLALLSSLSLGTPSTAEVGCVDPAGWLDLSLPLPLDPAAPPPAHFRPFSTAEEARAALERGEIAAYFVLPPSYPADRSMELVYREEPRGDVVTQWTLLLRANLVADRPPAVAARAVTGTRFTVQLPDGRPVSAGTILGQFLPAIVGLALFVLILIGSSQLMQAVADERTNRTMEILESSASAGQLMAGKVLGIVAATLLQLAGWIVLALLALLGVRVVTGAAWLADLRVAGGPLLVAIALVLLAYFLLAGLLTALGTMVSDPRAAEYLSGTVLAVYLMLVGFVVPVMRAPDGAVQTVLSLFPLTAPLVMPLRLAVSPVPGWQVAVSLALLAAGAVGAVWLAGRALRLGRLRYGQGLRLGEVLGRRVAARAVRPAARPEAAAPPGGPGRPRRAGKFWRILGFDLRTVLIRPAFLLTSIGLPLLIFVQLGLMEMAFSGKPLLNLSGEPAPTASPAAPAPEGYVDRSGLVQAFPEGFPSGALQPYAGEAEAGQALADGRIVGYYVIPVDYVARGEIVHVVGDHNPLAERTVSQPLQWLLLVNLLGGDAQAAAQVAVPQELRRTVLPAAGAAGHTAQEDDDTWTTLLPMMITLVLYSAILMSASYLLRAISEEKTNRVMEVLLLSVSPGQLLAGKTVACGIAGLLQLVLLYLVGYLLFFGTGWIGRMPAWVNFSPAALAWSLLLCLLGYAVYASLHAGAGALMVDWRASRGATVVLVLPALLGFYITLFAGENPNGPLITGASLFPLTAPFAMISRLVRSTVPLWQLVVSCAGMALTAYAIMRAVTAMFHAQNLLSGVPFSLRRYVQALRGRP